MGVNDAVIARRLNDLAGYAYYQNAVCHTCMQKKDIPTQTRYRRGNKLFCSYSCMRKYDRDQELKGNAKQSLNTHWKHKWMKNKSGVLERIRKCEENLELNKQKRLHGETGRIRAQALTAMAYWEEERTTAENVLKEYYSDES